MSRSSAFWRSSRWSLPINALAVGVVVVAAVVSGTMDSSNLTLVLMGFDADRAQLITALLIAGAAAAVAAAVTNRGGSATLAGLGGFAALFGYPFLRETQGALQSTGANGSFDLSGWLSTLITLPMAGLVSSWAGATLARALRPGLVEAASAIGDTLRRRRLDPHLLRRLLPVAVVLILLIFSVPIFGDMVNYTPDSRMLHGGAPPMGLIPEAPTGSPPSAPNTPLGASNGSPGPGSATSPLLSASNSPSAGASAASPVAKATQSLPTNQRPWLAWRPSGSGSVTMVNLPAPWTGGATRTDVGIYTPPWYDPTGDRRYPVLYEVPTGFAFWDSATNAKTALDTMIDKGDVPAMIVVFVSSGNGPYPDSECADSVDGREMMDTFISQSVVSYVDSHFLTIARADARATTGFSQGGYCAAILPLRHPGVFGTSIPFSGYYIAGSDTAPAKAPFSGDQAAMAAASPMVVATELPAHERAGLYFIVVAKPSDPYFGNEATEFEHLLASEGYSYRALHSSLGHGWDQVRREFPAALEVWATHLVAAGVF